jgi:hypothetical protein
MGFIYFQTTDTNERIGLGDAVLLLDDKGNKYYQPKYLGNGLVGGVDVFILTAQINGHTFDEDDDLEYERARRLGIDFFYENENAKLPKIYKP